MRQIVIEIFELSTLSFCPFSWVLTVIVHSVATHNGCSATQITLLHQHRVLISQPSMRHYYFSGLVHFACSRAPSALGWVHDKARSQLLLGLRVFWLKVERGHSIICQVFLRLILHSVLLFTHFLRLFMKRCLNFLVRSGLTNRLLLDLWLDWVARIGHTIHDNWAWSLPSIYRCVIWLVQIELWSIS